MPDAHPIVMRGSDAPRPPGPPTPGMDRRQVLEDGDVWVGWVLTEAGVAGGWHHHADRESYIYVIRGEVTIEYGPGGRERVTAAAGHVIVNPRAMVHREVVGPHEAAELFVVRVGPGPQNVNVDGPDPG